MENYPKILAERDRACLITPAGCGKTEIIARAVQCSDPEQGKQLILTHTHAGVKSLRDRLKRIGVSGKQYHIDTIDGFALQYALSFPISSGLGLNYDPVTQEWEKVLTGAVRIISSNSGKRIVGLSFCGVYVDEYQDCTLEQHQLILALANILPCRILGDPLQGIFGFKNNQIVNWYIDVFPNFERVGDKNTGWIPYRWKNKNEDLGTWLLKIRENLKTGKPIDLSLHPKGVTWYSSDTQNQVKACKSLLSNIGDSIVAIHHLPYQAHSLAKSLNGAYVSMEEVESADLMKWSAKLENSTKVDRALIAIEFAGKCMTVVSTELAPLKKKLEKGEVETKRKIKHQDIFECLVMVAHTDNLSPLIIAFEKIEKIEGRVLYRRELWHEMVKTLKEKVDTKENISLQKTALNIRNRERIFGRATDLRTVSRTLLIKGLEFDHAIVLNADDLNAKELYVAMTRGSKSLTILSSDPVLNKEAPIDLHPPK